VSVLSGDPAEAIASYAAREGLDLIVLTTHGRGRLARWCLGSVAETLFGRSETPLLLLHLGDTPRLGEYRRIAALLEGEGDHQVLEAALRLESLSPGARYVLAGVGSRRPPCVRRSAETPKHGLGRLTRELEGQGAGASWAIIGRQGVSRALSEVGRSTGADCIVVGTHALSGVDRVLRGNVAAKLLREINLPLLAVPLRGGRSAGEGS